jgi:myo-inositol-1(or 4)-monophosphatase
VDALLRLARDVAIRAGDFALEGRRGEVTVAATKSTPVDVVTQVDRDTERLIRGLIADARPDDGILGEEAGASVGSSGLTWVVDPIDGTVNYLYDIPAWAVSVAVVEGDADPATWRVLAGAVVNPRSGEVFTAAEGGGAWLGERRLATAAGVPLELALIGTGFGYAASRRLEQAAVLQRLIGRVRDIRRIGAASLDLCNVAVGRLDGYYERGLNPWDHAAGGLIAREAGARVAGLRGSSEGAGMLIAAQPALFASLESALIESGVDTGAVPIAD